MNNYDTLQGKTIKNELLSSTGEFIYNNENSTELVLDGLKINGTPNFVNFNELDRFNNVQDLLIRNVSISSENMCKLARFPNVRFQSCEIETIDGLTSIKKLGIINSKLGNINLLEKYTDLTDLELDNIYIQDYSFLTKLTNLKRLMIKNIKDFSLDKIDLSLSIEYLSIENIETLNLDLLLKLKNLKVLSVGINDANNFSKELEHIKKKGIEVEYNNIYNEQEDENDSCI